MKNSSKALSKNSNSMKEFDEMFLFAIEAMGQMFISFFKIANRGPRAFRFLGKFQLAGDSLVTIASLVYAIKFAISEAHLVWIHSLLPYEFWTKMVYAIANWGGWINGAILFVVFYFTTNFFLGIIPWLNLMSLQGKLNRLGFKDADKRKPKVLDYGKLDSETHLLTISDPGVGISNFLRKQDALSSAFKMKVLEIESNDKKPSTVYITFTTKVIPRFVSMNDLKESQKVRESKFYVGESLYGTEVADLDDLPHLIIAGTTGSGKSVCTKQILATLMDAMGMIQFYLLDLKGGVELSEFEKCPTVKLVDSMEGSVKILRKIKEEMMDRFAYLKTKGKSKLDDNDFKDRIVVCLDEASVLLGTRRRGSKDYELSLEARDLIEEIAKLGRAARINLILATQKVSQDSIDPRIQENITGRICFKTNTPENSIRVLGNGMAKDLPDIKGRAIWQQGDRNIEVQVPNITMSEIQRVVQKQINALEESDIICGELFEVGSKKSENSNLSLITNLKDNE